MPLAALPSSKQRKTHLHNLLGTPQVAHAYLQAESTPAGRLDDNTTVSQVNLHYNLQHQCTQITLALQTKQSWDKTHAHSNLFTASLLAQLFVLPPCRCQAVLPFTGL